MFVLPFPLRFHLLLSLSPSYFKLHVHTNRIELEHNREENLLYTHQPSHYTPTLIQISNSYECDSNFLWFGLLSRKTSRYNLFWVIKSPIHLYIYILGHCWTKSQKCTFLSSNPGIQRSCCSAVFISHKRLIIFTPRKNIYIYTHAYIHT